MLELRNKSWKPECVLILICLKSTNTAVNFELENFQIKVNFFVAMDKISPSICLHVVYSDYVKTVSITLQLLCNFHDYITLRLHQFSNVSDYITITS
jgi:hypothetical protein